MNFITFLQNANSNILSAILNLFNWVLFVQLAVGCCRGIRRGWTIGEATAGKIAVLAAISTILFRFWQSWPSEWVCFAVLPQCAFVVFAGGLAGCTLRWGVDRTLLRG